MLKEWQFNVLFFVGVGGAVFLLIGPEFGLSASSNPTAISGVGAILAYILTQKKALTEKKEKRKQKETVDDSKEGDEP